MFDHVAIRSFFCGDTEALFGLKRVARFVNIERAALRKLKQLDLAHRIDDLRAPPANRLEQLKGERAGQWSLRCAGNLSLAVESSLCTLPAVDMIALAALDGEGEVGR
jgi:proteic killer suppression protein